MAARYVNPDDFDQELRNLYGLATEYMDKRVDAMRAQIFTRINQVRDEIIIRVERVESRLDHIQQEQAEMRQEIAQIAEAQTAMWEAFKGFAADTDRRFKMIEQEQQRQGEMLSAIKKEQIQQHRLLRAITKHLGIEEV